MEYTIIRSNRRSLSITIDPDANLIVRAPRRMSDRTIAAFVASKRDWIEKHMEKVRKRAAKREEVPEFTEEERKALTKKARKMILEKVAYYAPIVGVTYGRIAIRKQRTVWGSCSSKGNLNFNYLLALMPDEVVDYVVVHELCHRKEMNHSPRFWAEVEKVIPDHKALRKRLKEEGSVYLGK
ncbi:MAG: M48 family metallopeptidase [Lachnospiraceae bacterium]|nr:M48 family metallopeptidase [Lachnospiraceae bacterium]